LSFIKVMLEYILELFFTSNVHISCKSNFNLCPSGSRVRCFCM